MFADLLLSLLKNTILLLSLGALYDLISMKPRTNSLVLRTLSGILLGLIAVAIISSPWSPQPGIIVDARSILLSISGLFFAPFSTLIASTDYHAFSHLFGWHWHVYGHCSDHHLGGNRNFLAQL